MNYFSLTNKNLTAGFKEAVIAGIAPDKGLYFPSNIPQLPQNFIDNIEQYTNLEIAYQVISPFVGNEIPKNILKNIIEETLVFDFPCVEVEQNIYSLELYHGPTKAFKDVGARFMSRCLGYFTRETSKKVTVLVATSGDTGGAVASGFLGVEGVDVVILYPSKKVSDIQEKQLTTLGKNITALEVNGVFDDCQDMVKTAFLDTDLSHLFLTSANSINIARWLPQMFYFFFAYKQLKKHNKPLTISCPSGNFGNICAGILAKKMGLPLLHFVASTNSNDTVPVFMKSGEYKAKPSIATLSNAMDVGNPSNFTRIVELYEHNFEQLAHDFSSWSYSDEDTVQAMQTIYNSTKYIAEPHGAVGYLGLKNYLKTNPNTIGVFLETAHPVKFLEEVESILNIKLDIPNDIAELLKKEKHSILIQNYNEFKKFLIEK
ncbi:threonine synthase [Flavobacterium croceum DSM 17960]|uniref:Threonine synthase n=1 Tax=Flavobacterium croceum DSM 17960 TaxID=1121886 RepID=A0A2S4N661_9FLAO|nr:threonine synthase [Flavobacterium croceum]POS01197.1 threonine synthase [Flavobacterium croceum DSM 17960]